MRFSLFAACTFAACVSAAPASVVRDAHVLHESRDSLPFGWRPAAKLHPDSHIPMRIALTQSNLHRAEEFLMEVSHPDSPLFGQHWSAKKVAEMFAPSDETVGSVRQWLAENGIAEGRVVQSQGLNWLHANVTVAEAESLLKTSYYEYAHTSGTAHVACEEYSLPESVRKHIDFITPTVHFDAKVDQPKQRRDLSERENVATPVIAPGTGNSIGSPGDKSLPKDGGRVPFGKIFNELENCDEAITPDCLRALYLFPENSKYAVNSGSMWRSLIFGRTCH